MENKYKIILAIFMLISGLFFISLSGKAQERDIIETQEDFDKYCKCLEWTEFSITNMDDGTHNYTDWDGLVLNPPYATHTYRTEGKLVYGSYCSKAKPKINDEKYYRCYI